MKIIQKGIVPPASFWWVGKQFSCKGCGCIFQMETGDHPNDDVRFTVPCPTCKATLRIKRPVTTQEKAVFDEIFGDGGVFEEIFGKRNGDIFGKK